MPLAAEKPTTIKPLFATRTAGEVFYSKALWSKAEGRKLSKGLKTTAQTQGLRYEAKVCRAAEKSFRLFMPQLAFQFIAKHDKGLAIPDGIILNESLTAITVVEIKLRHTADGWFQLNNLYYPVVKKAFPQLKVYLLEVTTFADLTAELPGKAELVTSVNDWVNGEKECKSFGVYSWRRGCFL
jgi:hypothetical protein